MKRLLGLLLLASVCVAAFDASAGTVVNRNRMQATSPSDSMGRDTLSPTSQDRLGGSNSAVRMRCVTACKRSYNTARNGCLHSSTRPAMSACIEGAKMAGQNCMQGCN